MEKNNLTLKETVERIRAKSSSAREVIASYVDTIEKKDTEVHAYLEVYAEDALREAEVVDTAIAEGKPVGALAGVPIALKDNILFKGKRASAASHMLENYTASYDSTVVRKLKGSGAIILGRANMDEFAMGSSTESSAFGITRNPADLERVPGGSSGGSAAAVAADECVAALGSDTGGSIRQPAAFCGVVGLKPTYGQVSRSGLIAMASSLDQIGPLTKTVEDAEILFNVLKGKDPFDSTTVELRNMNHEARSKEKLTIGVPKEFFGEGLDPEIAAAVQNTISLLRDSGFMIHEVSMPHADYSLACYYIIMPAEVSANLARFDGIRYGLSEHADNLLEVYTKTREKGFGAEARRRIILGSYVLSAGHYDAYYAKAQKVRALIRRDFERAFQEVDVIVSPTTPALPWKFGEKSKDPLEMYLEDIYTVPANLAGIPAMSVPCGKSKSGLPIGIQLMGRWFEEDALFRVGKEIEQLKNS